jgi:hypothetical protein
MIRTTATRWIVTGAVALGVAAGAAGVANAASGGSSTGPSSSHARPPAMGDPAQMSHGPGETVLTGSAAAGAKAAALGAVPGATVVRVETDSGPAAYEAHLRRSDGSYVTVKLDKGFHVVATQSGFGAGGPRPHGPTPSGGPGSPGSA